MKIEEALFYVNVCVFRIHNAVKALFLLFLLYEVELAYDSVLLGRDNRRVRKDGIQRWKTKIETQTSPGWCNECTNAVAIEKRNKKSKHQNRGTHTFSAIDVESCVISYSNKERTKEVGIERWRRMRAVITNTTR